MKTLILDVRSLTDSLEDFAAALKTGKAESSERISFATPDLLWKVLTAKRWELLKAMTGQGPMALRQAARKAGRDVKAVHTDAHALLDAGVLRKTSDGKIEFPFDTVRVEFMLKAA